MKKNIKIILTVILFICIQCKIVTGKTLDNQSKDVYIQQLQMQNKLLIEALNEFGASNKDEVIKIYAEGVKIRSGPLQYSVMCQNLKESFINHMKETENYSWVTGFSSPWVKNYKVIYDKKNKDNSYTVTIKFYWETSSGPFNESETTLTIVENNNIWCITNIQNEYE